MTDLLNKFNKLPSWLRILIALLLLFLVVFFFYYISQSGIVRDLISSLRANSLGQLSQKDYLVIFFIILAISTAVLLLFWLAFSVITYFRAKSLEARGVPIEELKNLAVIRDDLHQRLNEVVHRFRKARKNIYDVPWYLVMGPTGSGKTELIKSSQLQLVSSPLDKNPDADINWWFTMDALLVDVAGSLPFGDNVAKKDQVQEFSIEKEKWREFLAQLYQKRQECPINGLILTIPASDLILDSPEKLRSKGNEIAKQLDFIQRSLDFRFPVYITIAKCDLVCGFREFFKNLNDPELQQQIFGWSNPQELSEKFDPALFDRYFTDILKTLRKRRGVFMHEIRPSNLDGRRLDDVDTLYTFPEYLGHMIESMKVFLEPIFVENEWAPEPLTLRGVYMTSSIRAGQALIPNFSQTAIIHSETKREQVWEKDHSNFLLDVFIAKIFKEKGLVSRASNILKHRRMRKLTILSLCAAFLIGSIIFTYHQKNVFNRHLNNNDHLEFWSLAAKKSNWLGNHFSPILVPVDKNFGKFRFQDAKIKMKSHVEFHKDLYAFTQRDIKVPFLFKSLELISMDLNESRKKSWETIYETSILKPVFHATLDKLSAQKQNWVPEARPALAELVRFKAQILDHAAGESSKSTKLCGSEHPGKLNACFTYVLNGTDSLNAYMKDLGKNPDEAHLQRILSNSYKQGKLEWPPNWGTEWLRKSESPAVERVLHHDLDLFIKNRASEQFSKISGFFTKIQELRLSLLKQMETLSVQNKPLAEYFIGNQNLNATIGSLSPEAFKKINESWSSLFGTLDQEFKRMKGDKTDVEVKGYLADLKKEIWKKFSLNLKLLENPKLADDLSAPQKKLYSDIIAAIDKIGGSFHEQFKKKEAQYQLNRQLYKLYKLVDLQSSNIIKAQEIPQEISLKLKDSPLLNDRGAKEIDLTKFMLKLVRGEHKYKSLNDQVVRFKSMLKHKNTPEESPGKQFPGIPFTDLGKLNIDSCFLTEKFSALTDLLDKMRSDFNKKDLLTIAHAQLNKSVKECDIGFKEYLEEYTQYWQRLIGLSQVNKDEWAEYQKKCKGLQAWAINQNLEDFYNQAWDALTPVKLFYGEKCPSQLSPILKNLEETRKDMQSADKLLKKLCESVWNFWSSRLGEKVVTARLEILQTKLNAFKTQYMINPANHHEGYIVEYWHELSLNLLTALAKKISDDLQLEVKRLVTSRHFPLAIPSNSAKDLTAKQCFDIMEKVKRFWPEKSTFEKSTIGGSDQMTGDQAIDKELTELWSPKLLAANQAWLTNTKNLLPALIKSDGSPMEATVFIEGMEAHEKDKMLRASQLWPAANLAQSGAGLSYNPARTRVRADLELGKIKYPAKGPITLNFFKTNAEANQNQVDAQLEIPGNWAILRLLFDGPKKRPENFSRKYWVTWKAAEKIDDGKTWTCQLQFLPKDGEKLVFWLKLKFDKNVSFLQNWKSE